MTRAYSLKAHVILKNHVNFIKYGLGKREELLMHCRKQKSHVQNSNCHQKKNSKNGQVFLVGAGPGDPDLMTVKAVKRLKQAEVVLYDALINPKILEICQANTELICVGKRKDFFTLAQDQINQLIIDKAKKGKIVVRLKGGDPLIFGRCAEEIKAITSQEIAYEVVPGITSLLGASSSLMLSLTHRNHSSEIIITTGHLKDKQAQNFSKYTLKDKTLVIYMGKSRLEEISNELLSNKQNSELTPTLVIENVSLDNQRFFTAPLKTIAQSAKLDTKSPALIIIGDVLNEIQNPKESLKD
jgi:uroporphyrin-III C-methyltransferase/precorrin-2 dehydrogenase/sirohydrochlorin ferrochelatase